jgi:hypothetical protein
MLRVSIHFRQSCSLNDVAVDRDLPLAECFQVDDGAKRPTDQPLDFLRASALFA